MVEQDGEWFIAYSPEIPGANGQGKTKGEALEGLSEAIPLTLRGPSRRRSSRGSRGCHPTDGHRAVKRGDLLRHLCRHGCHLEREGGSHSLWANLQTGTTEAVPRHVEISDKLAR